MTKGRKAGLWIAGVVAGLVAAAVVFSLLAPSLISQQEAREKLQKAMSESTGGQVDFEGLHISMLPPHGTLSKVRISIPEQGITGVVESATVYLSILPLFKGSIRISRILIQGPDFHAALPQIAPAAEKEESMESTAANLAGGIYGGLSKLKTLQPEVSVSIAKGKLSVTAGKNPPFEFRDIDAVIDLPEDAVEMRIRAASNLWEGFSLTSKMDLSQMAGDGTVEVTRLQPQKVLTVFAPKSKVTFEKSQVDAKVRFQVKGPRDIEGVVEASSPKFFVRRGESTVQLSMNRLSGQCRFAGRQLNLSLTNLDMGYPRLRLSGRFTADQDGSAKAVELNAGEINVKEVRDLLLSLAGDIPPVTRALETVRGGIVKEAVLKSQGKTMDALTEPSMLDGRAEVNQMQIRIPELGLDLEDATGRVSLSGGTLKAQDLQARIGNTRASGGDLTLGVEGENPPFHLDVTLSADLSQVPSVLSRLVKDEDFREELKRIRQVEGSAQGRLILGDRLEDVNAKVDVTRMDLRAEHERLPYPVQITDGEFSYEGKRISVRDVTGRIGESSLSGVSGWVDWQEGPRIEASVDRAKADLAEVYPWLTSRTGIKNAFKDLESVRGTVDLSYARFHGPLGNPGQWTFQGKGGMEGVLVESHALPAAIRIVSGDFEAIPEQIKFDKIRVDLADTSLTASGSVTGYMKGDPRVDAGFEGGVGPIGNQWISERIGMPPRLRMRTPLAVSAARLAWGGGIQTAFSGDLVVSNGPRIALNITHDAEGTVVRDLTIQGTDSKASLSVTLGQKLIDLQFNGNLGAATTRQILEKSENFNGWIRGDFTARILKDKLGHSVIHGAIEAGDLALPGNLVDQVKIHRISLNASGHSVRIDSADLAWKETQMLLQGTTLDFKGRKINLKIADGRLCDLSPQAVDKASPGSGEPNPARSCSLVVQKMIGQFDLSEGEAESLLRGLHGQFVIKAGEGRIYRFGLLAKILAVITITEILDVQDSDLTGEGFGYKSANFEGKIQKGVILLKEGYLDGRSAGLACGGSIDLPAQTLDVTVLVAPLKTVDSIVSHIPLVGGILGKDFIAIPVRVKGDWSDPTVIPLSPTAVGSGLLGIVERTLKLPFKLFQPFLGEKEKSK